jgi:hypothetical protein
MPEPGMRNIELKRRGTSFTAAPAALAPRITSKGDLEKVKPLIERSYEVN